ncbi:MAG: HPF/RaiA family ribosome-associated protein [Planctomycetota bacterium]|jgi:ribosomal subunit interface protein|nr:HPF/RaiA family ribosome-associated protein [Planctomycetota bacterium]
MEILIHAPHITVTPRLRDLVHQRLMPTLDHHEDHIERVQVWLSEESAHSGERERCKMIIHTLNKEMLTVEETCKTQGAAITKAAAATERAVRRKVERLRNRRRKAA